MANVCDNCGETCYRTRYAGGKFLGVDCRCAKEARERRSAYVNPYGDLVLDHVVDERGNKVRVTSGRQLGEAEKRYDFAHVLHNMNAENQGPPQQKVFTPADFYRRKFRSA